MNINKKYFSIAEVTKETGLAPHKLRYIEKTNNIVEVIKIRERRYYTHDTIDYLRKIYTNKSININNNILSRIDDLLRQFYKMINQ